VDRATHWDARYQAGPEQVSWFQTEAQVSLNLLELCNATPESALIDVGGGASVLVDGLLARGWTDLTVLDISREALRTAQRRLRSSEQVRWVHHDLLSWRPDHTFDVWHDRAVFHFLVDAADRRRYRDLVGQALSPGGHVVIGTFAEDGPQTCSDLPVMRYSGDELARELGSELYVVEHRRVDHRTPRGGVQPFTGLVARRR
jgi:SAM-dependent methyltransferase